MFVNLRVFSYNNAVSCI